MRGVSTGKHHSVSGSSRSPADSVNVILHPLKSSGKVVVNNDLYVLKSYITICLQKTKHKHNEP